MLQAPRRSNFGFLGCSLDVGSCQYSSCDAGAVWAAKMAAVTAYKYQAQALMRDYLLADPLVPYTSVLMGIVFCKMVGWFSLPMSKLWTYGSWLHWVINLMWAPIRASGLLFCTGWLPSERLVTPNWSFFSFSTKPKWVTPVCPLWCERLTATNKTSCWLINRKKTNCAYNIYYSSV